MENTRPARGIPVALCASLGSLALLAACGGGGGEGASSASGGSSVTTNANTQLTGKAIDGYLPDVTICFDNGQGQCDTSLPTTTTDANGNYSLKVSGDVTGKHLLAIVPAGTTDATTGTTFQQPFVLGAIVAGSNQNITPLTSMVIAQMAEGKSQDDAAAAVQQVSGATDVNSDYVATGNATVSTFASQTVSLLQTYGGSTTSGAASVFNAVIAQGSVLGVTSASVAQQAALSGTAVDATTALSTPLYAMQGYLGTSVVMSDYNMQPAVGWAVREAYALSNNTLSLSQQVQDAGTWKANPLVGAFDSWQGNLAVQDIVSYDLPMTGGYLLGTDGHWTSHLSGDVIRSNYNVSSINDNTIVATDSNTGDTVNITTTTADVSGQPLATAIASPSTSTIRQAMTGTFPAGTKTTLLSIRHRNDQVIFPESGVAPAWVNGAGVYQPGAWTDNVDNWNAAPMMVLGAPSQQYASVQSVVGQQIDVSSNVQAIDCVLLSIKANGVAQFVASGKAGCDYSSESFPVNGSWSTYGTFSNMIVVSFAPKDVQSLNINFPIQANLLQGGKIVIGLMNSQLVSGYMLPASLTQTIELFDASTLDLVTASMHAAAKSIGITLNP